MPPGPTLDGEARLEERERPGRYALINAEPGRSRRAALSRYRQGRHRPRSSLLAVLFGGSCYALEERRVVTG